MAVYKVPQDVEAESKLVGPFTFRQFVFLLLLCAFSYGAWQLFRLAPFLIILPLPFIVLLAALAFPWRKDQPTEVYLTALIHFWLKPRKRIWNQEGHIEHVIITAPKEQKAVLTDGLSSTEVKSRLKMLAQKMDNIQQPGRMQAPDATTQQATALAYQQSDRLVAPQSIYPPPDNRPDVQADVLDYENNPVAQNFSQMVTRSTEDRKTQLMTQMRDAASRGNEMPTIGYNPYPDMRQSVVSPTSAQNTPPQQTLQTTNQPTRTPPSSDIINLANNSDLNVSTIARQADQAMQSGDTIELH